MIMKIIAVLSLLLVFWCHQSHHHLFLLISSGPIGLASEEFIPVSENLPTPESENTTPAPPVITLPNDGVPGSQIDKSDTVAVIHVNKDTDNVAGDTPNPNVEKYINEVRHPTNGASPAKENEKSHSSTGINTSENVDTLSEGNSADQKLEKGSPASNDLKVSPPETLDGLKPSNTSLEVKPISSNDSVITEAGNESQSLPKTVPEATSPTPPPQKEEEPIPSFMEWTQIQQKKLQESGTQGNSGPGGQGQGQNGHKNQYATNSQQNKSSLTGNQAAVSKADNAKNFASPDCGAKVIQSNPESQNANGVLSSSHDEYMLNKCGIPIWFVVELCEPLKIQKVSLGNLELFSSSPKEFEIGISDRYPTREWTKLGPFSLPDIRAIHSINLPATNASTFGKFLRVGILSHYGTEHFCPLSLLRVNGISEYEVLESENTHPEDIDSADKEESALYEEPVIDEQSTEGTIADKSVFGSAKDVVINIVKKAAQVLVKSDNTKESAAESERAAITSKCRSLLQCLPSYEMPTRERVLSLLSCNFSNLLPFLSNNSPWCGWDYCHALFSKQSIGLPWQPEGFYASLFGGPSVLYALCNYHKPLTKESCDTQFLTNSSAPSDDSILGEGYINESLQTPSLNIGIITGEIERGKDPVTRESELQSGNSETTEPVVIAESDPKSPTSESDQTTQPNGESVQATGGESQSQTPPPTSQGQQQQVVGGAEESNHYQNGNQPQSGQQQQKESVFVRLSNRIKTLERNQSMTASYLEELSRRFKKQNEENYHINEGTRKFVNESRIKFKVLEDLYRFELRSLRRNTEEIRERLFNVQLQRSLLILLCLLQFMGILSACVWVRNRFRHFHTQLESVVQRSSLLGPISSISPRQDSHQLVSGRKRLNSEMSIGSGLTSIDKSKKIRKKKKKLTELKSVSVKVAGPSSAPPETSGKESEFRFAYPAPISSASVFDIPSSSFKENVNPAQRLTGIIADNSNLSTSGATVTVVRPCDATLLSTQVDSPFSMISTASNFLVDSGVSTSSRFALLASPGPSSGQKSVGIKRSGSLTSLGSSSASNYSYGGNARPATETIMNGNGHGDGVSQGSGGAKKRKNKGLKALMPKIFDR